MKSIKKRMRLAIAAGAILGVFCIIGVGYRLGYAGNETLLFSFWLNRVLMGVLIGFAGSWTLVKSPLNPYFRGGLLGLLVSFAHFSTTGFLDATGFIAGIVYGIIIDAVATKYGR